MGMKLGSGGGRGGRSGRYQPMSEINVTPFVDVMLVLLIVFMVTAPLLTVGVPVDLPKTEASQLRDQVEPLVVTVNAEGRLFIQETETDAESLIPRLNAISQNKPETRIYVRGDQAINYGRVMEVMGLISQGGYSKVALIAEMPQDRR
ncbi:MAG: protein TolR [Alphaproteobacteria bacterium]|nr:protein TolR [Alphaproteobacteria bacterium]MBU0797715.1 protein TolR [Alphaproteobacteria bacterium]MBU0886711.1 protein TolR [Alphaproteobacteria bacterium]MBU1812561.1 protein TolR [Alphaproteobacteria bacterium]MBU2090071.1 protein TolR [Alphaproteobacteria bacterium]